MDRTLLLCVVLALPSLVALMVGVGTLNDSAEAEAGLVAAYSDMQNVRDSGYQKMVALSGADKLAQEEYQKLFLAAVQSQSRAEGAEAMYLYVQAHTPNPPTDLRKQVMGVMEDSLEKFALSQRRLLDQQRAYVGHLNRWPTGTIARMAGYPKALVGEHAPTKDLDGDGKHTVLDYPFLVTAHTQTEFANGVLQEVNPYAQ